MSLRGVMSSDLRAMIADFPQVFVFQDEEYTGIMSGKSQQKRLEIGGFEESPDMVIAINLTKADGSPQFVNHPQLGSRIRVNGIDYRVDRLEIDPETDGLELRLTTVNK